MSFFNDILNPARTLCQAPGISKKRLFETIARVISEDQPTLAYEEIVYHLNAREKLGSTGLGDGIAIPHCRVEGCSEPLGTLITLEQPIDFDSPDDQPVDLVFALLVPQQADQQHLDILAEMARLFSQPGFTQSLRNAKDNTSLFDRITRLGTTESA
ncbi:MAG: PTS sugar transporter subunit IIA [Pseudomonadota bacterium]